MNRISLLKLLATLALLPSCYGKANNNGLQGELSMGLPSTQTDYGYPVRDRLATVPMAVNASIQREFFRYTAHWASCSFDQQGCGSLTAPLAKLELVSCGCADASCQCSLTYPGEAGPTTRLLLTVTGTSQSRTLLKVKVKADGDEVEDTFPMEFRTPSRIGVYGHASQGATTRYASMPGAVFDLMPVLEGSDGTQLLADRAAYSVEVDGKSLLLGAGPDVWTSKAQDSYGIGASFSAVAPGESTVRFHAAGLTHQVKLKVGDYQQVTGFEIHAALPTGSAGPNSSRVIDPALVPDNSVEVDPVGAALTEIDVQAGGYVSLTSVLRLADGTLALGGAGALGIAPAEVAQITTQVEAFDCSFDLWGAKEGTAQLRSGFAPNAPTLPIRTAAAKSYP